MPTSAANPDRMQVTVNGATVDIAVNGNATLLSVLRQDLGLNGTRFGCGEGQCGSCTVLIDGRPVQSCQTPMWSVAGRCITTIEGLGQAATLGQVQQIFLEEQAAQCGYCTNGIVMTLTGLLEQVPRPDRAHILASLDERHLCRCGAHIRILRAIDRLLAQPAAGQK